MAKEKNNLGFKTLDDLTNDFQSNEERKKKTVLLRSDLNSDVKSKKLLESERIKESSKTIKELKKLGFKVVIIAHQGKPGKEDFLPLKQHTERLNKHVKVKYVSDVIGKKAKNKIASLKAGEALVLDNVRKVDDEFKPDKKTNSIIKNLVPLIDIYINDAFSVCHREQTSIVRFPKEVPSYSGRLLEREVNALQKLDEFKKTKKYTYVLGGAKPSDDLKLLSDKRKKSSEKSGKSKVLSCGLFGQMCLIYQGKDLGAQNKFLKNKVKYQYTLKKLKEKRLDNVETPKDFAVKTPANSSKKNDKKRKEIPLEDFPSEDEIFDIGERTINDFVKEIKSSKAIYMKGPVGDAADKRFRKGTKEILKAISESNAFSLLGGGHLTDALKSCKISKNNFDHVSLSGGALLNFVAGKKLPGLEVLKKSC